MSQGQDAQDQRKKPPKSNSPKGFCGCDLGKKTKCLCSLCEWDFDCLQMFFSDAEENGDCLPTAKVSKMSIP